MKTIFKVGDKVFHLQHGWGEVTIIDTEESYPITVCFNNNEMYRFTKEGRVNSWEKTPTLSFTEYTLQGFTQERPIVLPEVGELCLMRDFDDEVWTAVIFKSYNKDEKYPFISDVYEGYKQLKRIKILD
jgi:hypothetical protein